MFCQATKQFVPWQRHYMYPFAPCKGIWIPILGDPGAESGDEGKSKRTEKCGTKKSKERREELLGTMSYQTSSKRSPPFCLLIGQKNTKVFWHQSEARTAATVWNWSGKTLSPGALLAVLYFSSSCHIFPPVQTFPRTHYLPLGLRGCDCVNFRIIFTAMWVFLNNKTAAMLVSQTSPVGVELLSYTNSRRRAKY